MTAGLQTPIVPMQMGKNPIEFVPVHLRLQIKFVEAQPRLGPRIRIESENRQLLPHVMLRIPAIHKELVVILERGSESGPAHEILARLG